MLYSTVLSCISYIRYAYFFSHMPIVHRIYWTSVVVFVILFLFLFIFFNVVQCFFVLFLFLFVLFVCLFVCFFLFFNWTCKILEFPTLLYSLHQCWKLCFNKLKVGVIFLEGVLSLSKCQNLNFFIYTCIWSSPPRSTLSPQEWIGNHFSVKWDQFSHNLFSSTERSM